MRRWFYAIALVLAAAGPSARAHHSIAGVSDSRQRTTIEGVVSEFRFVSPHPFLLVDVSGADGERVSWQLEMDNRFELARIGITEVTFRAGDRVVASGSLSRSQPHTLYLRRLERPVDGLIYEQRGYSPTITAQRPRPGATLE